MAFVAQEALDALADEIVGGWRGLGARAVELPEEFALRGEFGGQPVAFRPQAFQGGGLDWARIGRLDGGDRVQVLNLVSIPAVGIKVPIVAVEALFFGGGLHLLVVDALGAGRMTREVLVAQRASLSTTRALEGVPEWGGGAFSEDLIFLKPGKKVGLGYEEVLPIIAEVARSQVEDLGDAAAADEETREARQQQRHQFLEVQREHEPARPFLERLTGDPALVERLVERFLYPELRGIASPYDT